MNILAFDTATSDCAVSLLCGNQIVTKQKHAPMQQAAFILPMIEQIIADAQLSLMDLDAIVYACGPGSFTGIRMASSVAQGIGYALDKPIIRISSLAMYAQAAFLAGYGKSFLVAEDARMNQIYSAFYNIDNHGLAQLSGHEAILLPEALILPAGTDWVALGNAWELYKEKIANMPQHIVGGVKLSTMDALIALAKDKFNRGEMGGPETAIPTYLR